MTPNLQYFACQAARAGHRGLPTTGRNQPGVADGSSSQVRFCKFPLWALVGKLEEHIVWNLAHSILESWDPNHCKYGLEEHGMSGKGIGFLGQFV